LRASTWPDPGRGAAAWRKAPTRCSGGSSGKIMRDSTAEYCRGGWRLTRPSECAFGSSRNSTSSPPLDPPGLQRDEKCNTIRHLKVVLLVRGAKMGRMWQLLPYPRSPLRILSAFPEVSIGQAFLSFSRGIRTDHQVRQASLEHTFPRRPNILGVFGRTYPEHTPPFFC